MVEREVSMNQLMVALKEERVCLHFAWLTRACNKSCSKVRVSGFPSVNIRRCELGFLG